MPTSDAGDHTGCSPEQAQWESALAKLQNQMTKPTFETHLRGTQVIAVEADTYIIGVRSDLNRDWLENRLNGLVTDTLSNLTGTPITIKYRVVSDSPRPHLPLPPDSVEPLSQLDDSQRPDPPSSIDLLSTVRMSDSHAAGGFVPVLHYVDRFWAAYWQRVKRRDAAAIWISLRSLGWQDSKHDWTPSMVLNASKLARRNQVGRQAIAGYRRQGRYYPSSLDVLRLAGFAVTQTEIDRRGRAGRRVSILRQVPLLTPWQVGFLTPGDQEEHIAFLERPLKVDLSVWQSITAKSLMTAYRAACDPPPFEDDGRDLADAVKYWPELAEHAYRADLLSPTYVNSPISHLEASPIDEIHQSATFE